MDKTFILRDDRVAIYAENAIRTALNSGDIFEMILRPFKSKRSKAQNRLLWKWYREISKQAKSEFGDYRNEDYWHTRLRLDFGYVEYTIQHKGFDVPVLRSTTDFSVEEFSDYLKQIEVWAMKRGLFLTFPDDYHMAVSNSGGATPFVCDNRERVCPSSNGGRV